MQRRVLESRGSEGVDIEERGAEKPRGGRRDSSRPVRTVSKSAKGSITSPRIMPHQYPFSSGSDEPLEAALRIAAASSS